VVRNKAPVRQKGNQSGGSHQYEGKERGPEGGALDQRPGDGGTAPRYQPLKGHKPEDVPIKLKSAPFCRGGEGGAFSTERMGEKRGG